MKVNIYITYYSLMYLLTDILFNSGSKLIPNAKNYRKELEKYLPEIFESVNDFVKNKVGKISAKNLESQFDAILYNWEQWRIFDQSYIQGLKMTLKVPKNFNAKAFESNDTLTLFESDFDTNGKAKTVALDIARLNYKRLQKEEIAGKLNLTQM